jgi:prevent-host-death family protein
MNINVLDAKTNLSKLIERALQGEDIVLARNGVPAVRLVPVTQSASQRTLGLGKTTVGADFAERSIAPLVRRTLCSETATSPQRPI